jgi:hypothetical protein
LKEFEFWPRDSDQVCFLEAIAECDQFAVAFAEDGLIEGFYDPQSKFTVGLQFHPERMLQEYEGNRLVYRNFVAVLSSCCKLVLLPTKACRQKAIGTKLSSKKYVGDLCVAAAEGNLDVVRRLIEHGMDINRGCPLLTFLH